MDPYSHMHKDITLYGSYDSSDSCSLRTPIFFAHRDFRIHFSPTQKKNFFITLCYSWGV